MRMRCNAPMHTGMTAFPGATQMMQIQSHRGEIIEVEAIVDYADTTRDNCIGNGGEVPFLWWDGRHWWHPEWMISLVPNEIPVNLAAMEVL